MFTSSMSRRLALGLCGAGLALASGLAAAQTSYPNKPVRLIVPFAAGGTTSILARMLAERMGQHMGQPIIVDNRPGAGGNVGMDIVAKAEPDGYTILMGPIGLAINPALYAKMPFDPIKDLAPIGLYAGVPNLLVVHPAVPANNVKELVAYAKAHPGKLNYASNGNGTSSHLAAEMLKSAAGVDIVHVPYKGGGPAMQDLIGGQVSMLFDQMPAVLPQVQGGRVRALGVSSVKRSAAAQDIPAVSESLPGFDMTVWFGFLAPKGTPADIVARLNAEMNRALKDTGFQSQLAGMGVTPMPGSSAEFGSFIRREMTHWAKVVKDSGAKID
ncbi:MAG: tripartite tricarboxylate transporter substrate binding protein [Polaromonas sp.]|uniref:Bug family tripartite tricarboxylate transporter substrate binding protein n=1 Tax=Polaromonas sp. TaxID=1869339 RepID=UPI0027261CAF|nr:tripartite tricarboxylate transporter substrate binding protein [Polaromonas sp.]MDO9114312.1 tripartite tricarboxylate transporter substrate binding protein [Polaromonas sp.]MDP1886602.1 tripartite tricarboxylate transporter substrate binding protein [Polaromonas sp.]